jgi:hypothetical protein
VRLLTYVEKGGFWRGPPPLSLAITSFRKAGLAPVFALHQLLSGAKFALAPPIPPKWRASKKVASSVETRASLRRLAKKGDEIRNL